MLYINPSYIELLAYHSSQWNSVKAGEGSVSSGAYIGRGTSDYTDDTSQYCGVTISPMDALYLKVSLYWLVNNYHGDISIVIDDNGSQTTLILLDSYTSSGMYGYHQLNSKEWFDVLFHLWLAAADDGKYHLYADGMAGRLSCTGKYSKTGFSSAAKITEIRFRSSLDIRDIIISDTTKLHKNDTITELAINSHGGDFTTSSGGYELAQAGKTGTVTLDTSNITTADYQLLGATYACTASRNNEEINDISVTFGGETKEFPLADGDNAILVETKSTDKTTYSTVSITAKKV